MTTGHHIVRDIYCVKCGTTLGWKYVSVRFIAISSSFASVCSCMTSSALSALRYRILTTGLCRQSRPEVQGRKVHPRETASSGCTMTRKARRLQRSRSLEHTRPTVYALLTSLTPSLARAPISSHLVVLLTPHRRSLRIPPYTPASREPQAARSSFACRVHRRTRTLSVYFRPSTVQHHFASPDAPVAL